MQHIGVIIEDEKHKELSRSNVNFADILNTVLENTDNKKYPWLWSIDPYGLTVFNFNQIIHFKSELEIFSGDLSKEGSEIVKELLSFVQKIQQHTYIVFIGD